MIHRVVAIFFCLAGLALGQKDLSRPGADDPFHDLLDKATALEDRWHTMQNELKTIRAKFDPCDPSRRQALRNIHQLGIEKTKAWDNYYVAWRESLEARLQTNEVVAADDRSHRKDAEVALRESERELGDLQSRRNDVASGTSAKTAVLAELDELIGLAQVTVATWTKTLAESHGIETDRRVLRENAQEQLQAIESHRAIVRRAGKILDDYYVGLIDSDRLGCKKGFH